MTDQTRATIFLAERERRLPLALLGFIGLSLFAHATTFFVFQVIYPQRVTLPPPALRVTLLRPETPEQEALLHWVDAEDPALVAATIGAEPPGLLQLEYHPSFQTLRTPPRTPPEEVTRPEQPPSSIPIDFTREPGAAAAAPPPSAPVPTAVKLAGGLQERTLVKAGSLAVQCTDPLQPAQFLVALDDRGQVRETFLQRSSGDAQANAAAAAYLAQATFSSGTEALSWGMVTIVWGDDAYVKTK